MEYYSCFISGLHDILFEKELTNLICAQPQLKRQDCTYSVLVENLHLLTTPTYTYWIRFCQKEVISKIK
jgi:hypothetical protein